MADGRCCTSSPRRTANSTRARRRRFFRRPWQCSLGFGFAGILASAALPRVGWGDWTGSATLVSEFTAGARAVWDSVDTQPCAATNGTNKRPTSLSARHSSFSQYSRAHLTGIRSRYVTAIRALPEKPKARQSGARSADSKWSCQPSKRTMNWAANHSNPTTNPSGVGFLISSIGSTVIRGRPEVRRRRYSCFK
jgi:hypothetical protein